MVMECPYKVLWPCEEKTKAGILLPEKAQGAVNEAVVIAVGPGIKNKLSMIRVCNARSGARNERSI